MDGKRISCRTKEDPAAWDRDDTRKRSGRDRPPRPRKMQALGQLAKALQIHPSQITNRNQAFQALVDWVAEDACMLDEEQTMEPLDGTWVDDYDAEWTRSTGIETKDESVREDVRACRAALVPNGVPREGARAVPGQINQGGCCSCWCSKP